MAWYKKGYEGEPYLESYFKKKKTDGKFGFFSSFNKRWFMLDFPNSTLSYSTGPNKKVTWVIPFKDIVRVKADIDGDQMRVTTSAKKLRLLSKQITIYTVNKVYDLYAFENNTKSTWAYALKFIVKSKAEHSNKRAFSWVRSSLAMEDYQQESEVWNSVADNEVIERNRPRFMSTGRVESLINSPLSKNQTKVNKQSPYWNENTKQKVNENVESKENIDYRNEKLNKPPIDNYRSSTRKSRGSKQKLVKQRKANVQNSDSIEILSPSYKNSNFNIDSNPYESQLFSYS